MKWKIKFEEVLYNDLKRKLFRTFPKENGCFLLTRVVENQVFVTDVFWPKQADWLVAEEDHCSPTSAYINSAVIKAKQNNASLLFIHTHPKEYHPTGFSIVDVEGNRKLFRTLLPLINEPVGSLVFSRKGIHGVIANNEGQEQIESYYILGRSFSKLPDTESDLTLLEPNGKYDRQQRMMGEERQNLLQQLKIGVVGAGGIGSPLVYQLAKMGIASIHVFDNDKIDDTNIPRVYGADEDRIGDWKVDVLKDFIEANTDCEVIPYPIKINSNSEELRRMDVIFGGVDKHSARDAMNTIAIKYAIPYVDAACSIPLTDDGQLIQSLVEVFSVMPTTPCMWCAGKINFDKIREENYSEEEKQQLIEDGYYNEVEKQPSVICLTTMAASLAIHRLFNLMGIYKDGYPQQWQFELNECLTVKPKVLHNEKCRCKKLNPLRSLIEIDA